MQTTTVVRISKEQMRELEIMAQMYGLSRLQTINLLVDEKFKTLVGEDSETIA